MLYIVYKALGGGRENEVLWNRSKIVYDDLEEKDFF
jgi:hypothetical protein